VSKTATFHATRELDLADIRISLVEPLKKFKIQPQLINKVGIPQVITEFVYGSKFGFNTCDNWKHNALSVNVFSILMLGF
jgi:hypothetical protein